MKICVYDTVSRRYVELEVNEEIYHAYMRTEWNIRDNNESFYDHEIQFSALIGGQNEAYEKFHEFVSEKDSVENAVLNKICCERLKKCLDELSVQDRELIYLLFFEGKTERECAVFLKTSQQNIHKKKGKILCKLNKLLEK